MSWKIKLVMLSSIRMDSSISAFSMADRKMICVNVHQLDMAASGIDWKWDNNSNQNQALGKEPLEKDVSNILVL